jgi:hypothetical protein
MRQVATLFIFVFMLLIVVLIFLSHSLAIVQRVAVVDSLTGSAELLRDGNGKPAPLNAGQLVHAGDVIRTGPNGSVELRWARWAGGTRIKLGPNTRFTVKRAVANRSSGNEESRLRVDEGSIWVRLRKKLTGKSKFEVETPTAVAAVRGTVFKVSVDKDGTSRVSVWEGTVAVALGAAGEVMVSDGSALVAGHAVQAASPESMTEAEQEEWQEQTSVIGPFLAVEAPADGAKLTSRSLTVSGRTEPDCAVAVNGAAAAVSREGRFSATVELPEGSELVEAKATAPDGSETLVAITVAVSLPAEAAPPEQPAPSGYE